MTTTGKKVQKKSHWKYLLKAVQSLLNLSAASRQILLRKQAKGEKTAVEWLQILAPLAQFDQYSDALRKPLLSKAIWGLIISTFYINYAHFFLFAFLLDSVGFLPEYFVYIFLNILYQVVYYSRFLFFLFLILYFVFRHLDLHDGLRLFLTPMLTILQQETKTTQVISLQLVLDKKFQKKYLTDDYVTYKTSIWGRRSQRIGGLLIPIGIGWALLNGIFEHEIRNWLQANWGWKYIDYENVLFTTFFILGGIALVFIIASFIFPHTHSQKADPNRGYQKGYPKFRTKIYEFPWLSISTRLSDGTALHNQFLEKTFQIIRTRKNYRGKVKTKTKYKTLHFCNLRIGLSSQKYDLRTNLQVRGGSSIKLKQNSNEKRHTFDFRFRLKAKKPTANIPTGTVISFIRKVYGIAQIKS